MNDENLDIFGFKKMQLKGGRACLGITVKRLFLFLFCCFVFVVVNVVRKKT